MRPLIGILLIVLTCLLCGTGYSQDKVTVSPKISLDVAGNHKASTSGQSGSLGVDAGISIGIEVLSNSGEHFNFGIGLTYLIPREQEITGSGTFSFIPIYAVGKVWFGEAEQDIIPAIVANLGYSAIYTGESAYKGPLNLSGGFYLGGGLRMEVGKTFFEGMYKSFNGSASYSNVKFDVTYTTFSLTFGFLIK